MPSYDDINFRIVCSNKEEFVLKVSNFTDTRKNLELQNGAMLHLKKNGIQTPSPLASVKGEEISVMDIKQQNECFRQTFVRALHYVPGVLLADVELSLELSYDFGKTLGIINRLLQSYDHPGAHRYLAWDLANSKKVILGHLPFINDEDKQTLVHWYIHQYEAKVEPVLPRVRKGIIHGDPNDHNILVHKGDDGVVKISGVLDFGDLVYTHVVNEISIAAGYAMLSKPEPIKILSEMIAGYHNEFPFTEAEKKIIYILACMRLCTSAVMGS